MHANIQYHMRRNYLFIYQLLHLPFKHEQVAVIGLMLSVTALSCQCGTNEPAGSGFQPHSIGQVCWF